VRIVLECVFWLAIGLVFYAYIVYPMLILKGMRGGVPADIPKDSRPDADLPEVSVIVAAYNEEVHIGARIENLLHQDYPRDKLTILVGSDGSSDRTVEIANNFSDPRLRVLAFAQNRGKASVLNDCVADARSSVLVFTDANTVFATNTVRELVAALGENTAVACGELILHAPAKAPAKGG